MQIAVTCQEDMDTLQELLDTIKQLFIYVNRNSAYEDILAEATQIHYICAESPELLTAEVILNPIQQNLIEPFEWG